MHTTPRNRKRTNQIFYVTCTIEGREPILRDPVLACKFLAALQHFRHTREIFLYGFVIMPDHVHFICKVINGMTISSLVRRIKTFTSIRESFKWQRRFWSAAIDNQALLVQKLNYIHANPVRAGLVEEVSDYPWSSWADYHTKKQFELVDPYSESEEEEQT